MNSSYSNLALFGPGPTKRYGGTDQQGSRISGDKELRQFAFGQPFTVVLDNFDDVRFESSTRSAVRCGSSNHCRGIAAGAITGGEFYSILRMWPGLNIQAIRGHGVCCFLPEQGSFPCLYRWRG